MNIDKRDLILESIIQAYLELNEPIGSSELGSRMSVSIPASTIRVYFKKLSDEGAITQLHISGGRIPTAAAMSYYWHEKLDFSCKFSIDDPDFLSFLVNEFGIYCIILGVNSLKLSEIINVNDRFLLLDFSGECIALRFNAKVEKFLNNLIGIDLNELEQISAQIGLSELRSKLGQFKNSQIYFRENEKIAFEIFGGNKIKSALGPEFTNYFRSNLAFAPAFSDGYMGLKTQVSFEGKDALMLCAGSVYSDYEKFLLNIKEAA